MPHSSPSPSPSVSMSPSPSPSPSVSMSHSPSPSPSFSPAPSSFAPSPSPSPCPESSCTFCVRDAGAPGANGTYLKVEPCIWQNSDSVGNSLWVIGVVGSEFRLFEDVNPGLGVNLQPRYKLLVSALPGSSDLCCVCPIGKWEVIAPGVAPAPVSFEGQCPPPGGVDKAGGIVGGGGRLGGGVGGGGGGGNVGDGGTPFKPGSGPSVPRQQGNAPGQCS